MDPVEVKIHIHKHSVILMKSGRTGYCCGIKFGAISEGYYCDVCDLFFHMVCTKAPIEANHPSHKCDNALSLSNRFWGKRRCALCGGKFKLNSMNYRCSNCYTALHLYCAEYPPKKVIKVPQNHYHPLKLETRRSRFTCDACEEDGDGYPYKCYECHLTFHVDCERREAEIKHRAHSLHPLSLIKEEPPTYTGGICRFCGDKLGNYEVYYHCYDCNFSLDLKCVVKPPPMHIRNPNIHDHKLTLMPKSINFTCTTCGLDGDRSPYVCLRCDFTSHNDCYGFPWVININRHDHRVTRTSNIAVVEAVCGVCQKKMDWSCGGYSCKRCPESVYHTKCATREDVSDNIEMKDKPEENKDMEPFEVIGYNTIRHFSHEMHNLRLDRSGIFVKEICKACVYPIYHHSFFSCMSCESFLIHESCAKLPMWKRHVVSNMRFLCRDGSYCFDCEACGVICNGFCYGDLVRGLDVRCASIPGSFLHKSHPHPLFYTSPRGVCSACKKKVHHVLRCVDDDCGYILDFKCALLPYEVKHRVDEHFLSLCFGEDNDKASGKYWCDICEKETDPKLWFYTSTDRELTLHVDCVLGDFRALEPGKRMEFNERRYEIIRNNSMSRPLCHTCKLHCIFPILLKLVINRRPDIYFCSIECSKHEL